MKTGHVKSDWNQCTRLVLFFTNLILIYIMYNQCINYVKFTMETGHVKNM